MSAGPNFGPGAPRMFANGMLNFLSLCRTVPNYAMLGAQEYFDKYGANINHLARIGKSSAPWKPDQKLTPWNSLEEPQALPK